MYALWSHFVRPPVPDSFVIVYDCEQMQPCALPMAYAGWETAQGAFVKETEFVNSAPVGQQFREELLVYWATAFSESRVSMGVGAHLYARVLGSADQRGRAVRRVSQWILPQRDSVRVDAAHVPSRPAEDARKHEPGRAPDARHRRQRLGRRQRQRRSRNNHTHDSPEWQSAALVEGFADFYSVVVFNRLEEGAWLSDDVDVENDTMRFQAQCQAALDTLVKQGDCTEPGDATMCTDAGASNEIDWAGTLWDFTKVVGESELPNVLRLLSDAGQMNWDPGSTTTAAYEHLVGSQPTFSRERRQIRCSRKWQWNQSLSAVRQTWA